MVILCFQFLVGFTSARIQGVELVNLGQQRLGTYPIHYHRAYDVDGTGTNEVPSYAKELSIHHSFSRCVTLHSTHGVLVSEKKPFSYSYILRCP